MCTLCLRIGYSEVSLRSKSWSTLPARSLAVCCGKKGVYTPSSVILWTAHDFSLKYGVFSILCFPFLPPVYWAQRKTNWGMVFGLCGLKSLVLLQNISSNLGCIQSGITPPKSSLCVCARSWSAAVAASLWVCVCEGVYVCVCVSKVGCLNALLHYVNSSAVQSNSCRN